LEPWVKVLMLTLGGALGVNSRNWLGDWNEPLEQSAVSLGDSYHPRSEHVVLASWLGRGRAGGVVVAVIAGQKA